MTENKDLADTLESIRNESFPNLSETLLKSILEIETQYIDDRNKAMNKIEEIVLEHIEKEI